MLEKNAKYFNISNSLTFARILLIPFIVLGIVHHMWLRVFILLIVAGLTDVLDGHLARRFNLRTEFGAILDPIADKLLLIASFTALSFVDSPSFGIPLWFLFLVFIREAIIVGGFIFLFISGIKLQTTGGFNPLSPSIAGKLTTFFQLSFILWIFICYFFGWNPVKTYSVVIVFLSLFSLASLGQYGMRGIRYWSRK